MKMLLYLNFMDCGNRLINDLAEGIFLHVFLNGHVISGCLLLIPAPEFS